MPQTVDLPPEIAARLEQLEQLEQRETERRGEYDKLTQRLTAKHAEDVKRYDTRLSAFERALIRAEATSAISAARGDVEALLPHVAGQLRIVEENGEITVGVAQEGGKSTRPSLRGRGAMKAAELVEELRGHRSLGLLFEGGDSRVLRTSSDRVVTLSREQSGDSRRYRALKEQVARGEIDRVVDWQGRPLIG